MSADAACQHDTALLTARLCRWWFAGEVKTALQLEAVSFIGSASIERITLAIFLIFLNGWWPYHLHAFAAMPRPGNWAPRSISRSNFSQVTGGACRKCWYGNKVFGRSLANIPKWSGSRCKLQVSFCGFARFSLLRNDLTKACGGANLMLCLHGKQMANSLSHWICCAFPSSNKICPTFGGFASSRDECSGLSKGRRSPGSCTNCCGAGRDPVTWHVSRIACRYHPIEPWFCWLSSDS